MRLVLSGAYALAGLLAALILAPGAAGAEEPRPPAAGGAHAEAAAPPLVLEGRAIEGGLMIGRTSARAKVWLDGRPVRVSKQGVYLLGFPRDAGREARLEVQFPDGRTATRLLRVEQRAYEIERIDGLPERKVTPSPEDLRRIAAERARIDKARARFTAESLFESGFIWPLTGRISGVYGSVRVLNGKPRAPHLGLDIVAPKGTTVVAPADGVVSLAYRGMFFSGNVVVIDHGLGLSSVYAHLERVLVTEAESVAQGVPIGTVGATGRVTGPHLHWGVHLFALGLDPELLVRSMPGAASGAAGGGESTPGKP